MLTVPTQYTSYTQARDNFVKVLEEVEKGEGIVVIQRRGHEDVAMISAAELSSMMEEIYLLRSPANSQRLHEAIAWAQEQIGKLPEEQNLQDLRAELEAELGEEKAL